MINFEPGDIAIALPEEDCRYGGHSPIVLRHCRVDFEPGAQFLVLSVEEVHPNVRLVDPNSRDGMHLAGKPGFYCCGCFTKKPPATLEPEAQATRQKEDA